MGLMELIIGIIALAAGLFGGQLFGERKGRKRERTEQELRDANKTNQAMKDVNNADANQPADVADALDRLRGRNTK